MMSNRRDPVSEAVDKIGLVVPFGPGLVKIGLILEEHNLLHLELPSLSRSAVYDYLEQEGFPLPDLGEDEPLEGFLYAVSTTGIVFVNSDENNPISRRRFTAAHELGHFLLHRDRMTGGRWIGDTKETIREAGDAEAAAMEREANRFAAEILMPRETCLAMISDFRRDYRNAPNSVLIHRLSADLLVSREAMRNRLVNLGIINDRDD
jgi:Zn-dependent peptidase ImmA (M78 family)